MKKVYISMSTGIIHGGHLQIIQRASKLGLVIVGVLTDKVVASYKNYPILPFEERVKIISGLKGVSQVVEQDEFSPQKNLMYYRPDYLVHGDDWKSGFQEKLRKECISIMNEIGGELIEFPYSELKEYSVLENEIRSKSALPDIRRRRFT